MLSKYVSYITSSFYSCILLCKAKLANPSKKAPKRQRTRKGQAGLKTLFPSASKEEAPPRPRVINRCAMEESESAESEASSPAARSLSWMWSPSSPACRTSIIGDVIGTESGDCMVSEEEELIGGEAEGRNVVKCRERREKKKRDFPAPLTLLRETGKMPWSLERKYSGEGRLIITAERVRGSQECCVMETHREDGRLTMRLVAEEDDDDYCEECCYPMGFEFDEVQLAKEGSNEVERCRDLRVCATYDGAGPGAWLQLHRSICTLSLISTWAGPLPHL